MTDKRHGVAYTRDGTPLAETITWMRSEGGQDATFATREEALEACDRDGWRGYAREYPTVPAGAEIVPLSAEQRAALSTGGARLPPLTSTLSNEDKAVERAYRRGAHQSADHVLRLLRDGRTLDDIKRFVQILRDLRSSEDSCNQLLDEAEARLDRDHDEGAPKRFGTLPLEMAKRVLGGMLLTHFRTKHQGFIQLRMLQPYRVCHIEVDYAIYDVDVRKVVATFMLATDSPEIDRAKAALRNLRAADPKLIVGVVLPQRLSREVEGEAWVAETRAEIVPYVE